uniref:Uncharacterized protein n=1 Tax=Parascaris equorum TaxID=6256 RepID=A0A914RGQ2_PAREQ
MLPASVSTNGSMLFELLDTDIHLAAGALPYCGTTDPCQL